MLGHEVELVFTTHNKTMAKINTIVVQEEIIRHKKKKEAPFQYVEYWKTYWKI